MSYDGGHSGEGFVRFCDMCSGGRPKTDWEVIVIEGTYEEACAAFEERFGLSPHGVTCDCCGDDYTISEYATLGEATGRGFSGLVIRKKEP